MVHEYKNSYVGKAVLEYAITGKTRLQLYNFMLKELDHGWAKSTCKNSIDLMIQLGFLERDPETNLYHRAIIN